MTGHRPRVRRAGWAVRLAMLTLAWGAGCATATGGRRPDEPVPTPSTAEVSPPIVAPSGADVRAARPAGEVSTGVEKVSWLGPSGPGLPPLPAPPSDLPAPPTPPPSGVIQARREDDPKGAEIVPPSAIPLEIAPLVPIAPGAPLPAGVGSFSCATCGQAHLHEASGGCSHGGCGGGGCIPGRKAGYSYEASTLVGRFFGNLYECLCCPDPCYKPGWVPQANASFFQDYARPRTIARFRWDNVSDFQFPDRSEFFWARDDGKGAGPQPPHPFPRKVPAGSTIKQVQYKGERSVSYDQLYYYQEAAAGRSSFFIEIPYRSTHPYYTDHHAGFSDMNLGTKSLLLDCELLQITFQFKTYLPTGQSIKGLGTGHVSLEPSLLASLRLSPDTYLQGQIAEWIPLGGDPAYAGAILHYHGSLNHVLYRLTPDVPVIGTLEGNAWSFQDGAYTDPVLGSFRKSSGDTYFNLGPGLRVSVCNNVDFGAAVAFPLSEPHWANPIFRSEFRILY